MNRMLRVAPLALAFACAASSEAPSRDPDPTDIGPSDGAASEAEALGPGIVRFYASDAARAAALPSYAFENPRPEPTRDVIPEIREGLEFDPTPSGPTTIVIDADPGTSLYGLGEAPGPLERSGARTTLWNTDAYGYRKDTPSLYQSHPWVLAVREDGTSFGVLVDTTHRITADLSNEIEFRVEGPPPPVIWFEGDTPEAVLTKLADMTGTMPMPPKWALGFHQSRYSYFPEQRVRALAAEFRARDIPCDVIWFDIDYMDSFRIFTFDEARFPDPKGLNEDLLDSGFHNVWMINPGIAADPEKFPPEGYFVYEQVIERDLYVRSPTGDPVRQRVWPGPTVFPDFTRPDVRAWWASLYEPFIAHGITGVWNDMNEPAVFDHPTRTLPESSRHGGEPALGGGGDHARFHNVYGMLMARATREGIAAARPERRPFVLTRANFIGGHRYAATWTGDNRADWWDLEMSVAMILNLGLSGQPFSGPDIGGFIGTGSPELFARWMGVGALLPFSRAHTAKNNPDKEPWSFGEAVESTSRRALENRYALMPHLYTVFEEAHRTGLPVARPVFFADPTDPDLRTEDDAFLLGDNLLVVPRLDPANERTPDIPQGAWRSFVLHGDGDPNLPELRLGPREILPVGPPMEHVDAAPLDPLTLIVNLDASGVAEGWLYEDAGDGYEFVEGEFRRTRFTARRTADRVRIELVVTHSGLPAPDRSVRVRLLTEDGEIEAEGFSDRPIIVSMSD